MSNREHGRLSLISPFSLPFTVLILIPALLLWWTDNFKPGWGLGSVGEWLVVLLGLAIMGAGLCLMVVTIRLFWSVGKGTLAPWAPPKKLVVAGPYRYMRNPMISGVLVVLLGEALFFGSLAIFIFAVAFFVVNHFYFIFWEETGLVRRFGDEYLRYQENVPRWLPRLKPWQGDE